MIRFVQAVCVNAASTRSARRLVASIRSHTALVGLQCSAFVDLSSLKHCVSRNRKRGPRAQLAKLRRDLPKKKRDAPYDTGKAETSVSESLNQDQPFTIYNINIRCLLAHHAELCFHVQLHAPHVIFIQESWLNETIESKDISNSNLLS